MSEKEKIDLLTFLDKTSDDCKNALFDLHQKNANGTLVMNDKNMDNIKSEID